jgi:hypothetical protein
VITYAVRARNTAPESENRIHADDVAQDYGFKGGLVPGVTVYAYMVRPVVESLGRDWISRGAMSARLHAPLYDGDDATVDFDGETITVRNGEGAVCATGTAGWTTATPPKLEEYPLAPMPDIRPPASPESLTPGRVLGAIEMGFHADRAHEYLDPISDDLPIWRDARIAHPGYLVTFANYILSSNVKLGPWIHVETSAEHFSEVADGERWSIRGRVADNYERKGHKFVVLDLLVATDRPIATYRHTAIYEPAKKGHA